LFTGENNDDKIRKSNGLEKLAVTGPNLTASQALKALIEFLEHSLHGQVYLNDTYQVIRNEIDNGMVHLSIRRLDRSHEHDWREYQEIKNQLLGEECEAFEIYPAESRCVDLANQFHGPATIVWWTKASKTVVKLAKGDKHDPVKAFLIAFFLFRSGMTRVSDRKRRISYPSLARVRVRAKQATDFLS